MEACKHLSIILRAINTYSEVAGKLTVDLARI